MNWKQVPCSLTILSLITFSSAFAQTNNKIYGLENALHYVSTSHRILYIQVASFEKQSNAKHYKHLIQAQTKHTVSMVEQNKHYLVLIGPMHSASEIRQTAAQLLHRPRMETALKHPPKQREHNPIQRTASYPKTSARAHLSEPVKMNTSVTENAPTNARWYAGAGAGAGFSINKNPIYIANGSSFPPPYDKDVYTTTQANSGLVNLSFGRQWNRGSVWIPSYSVGILYQHHFNGDVGGQVTQYSAPQFTNYNYNWNLSSDSLLASFKLNLYTQSRIAPYVNVGIGGAANHANYEENALPGVRARISPDFSGTQNRFVYNAGAGIDIKGTDDLLINLAYLYQNLGRYSYSGQGSWANTSLDLGSYELNEVVVGVTYLFGK